MKSFAVAAIAGAASASWAPPAYGGSWSSSTAAAAETTSSAASTMATSYGSWNASSTASAASESYVASTTTWVTEVVTSMETYCPYATKITTNGKTYTATEATTLTITDCPCEVTKAAQSVSPVYTTEVETSTEYYCPEESTIWHMSTAYTVPASHTLTITGYTSTVTKQAPQTWVVSSYESVYTKPASVETVTVGTETKAISEATTYTWTAQTTWETYTSVYTHPEVATTVVVNSATYPLTEATSIVYSSPVWHGMTVTAPLSQVWQSAPAAAWTGAPEASPAAESPAAQWTGAPEASPVAPWNNAQPSAYAPGAANTTMPYVPEQTGNGAGKLVAGAGAMAAVFGAFFL